MQPDQPPVQLAADTSATPVHAVRDNQAQTPDPIQPLQADSATGLLGQPWLRRLGDQIRFVASGALVAAGLGVGCVFWFTNNSAGFTKMLISLFGFACSMAVLVVFGRHRKGLSQALRLLLFAISLVVLCGVAEYVVLLQGWRHP